MTYVLPNTYPIMRQKIPPGKLSAREMCEYIGITSQNHSQWVSKGLLARRNGYGELDAAYAVVLHQLQLRLRGRRAEAAWSGIREQLADHLPSGPIIAVYSVHDGEGHLVRGVRELGHLMIDGGAFEVMPLGLEVNRARAAVRAAIARQLKRLSRGIVPVDDAETDAPAAPG